MSAHRSYCASTRTGGHIGPPLHFATRVALIQRTALYRASLVVHTRSKVGSSVETKKFLGRNSKISAKFYFEVLKGDRTDMRSTESLRARYDFPLEGVDLHVEILKYPRGKLKMPT